MKITIYAVRDEYERLYILFITTFSKGLELQWSAIKLLPTILITEQVSIMSAAVPEIHSINSSW